MHATTTGRRQHAGAGSTAGSTTGRTTTRRPRWAPAVAAALAVTMVGACSTGPEGDGDDASPTFQRASGASLTFEEPVANPTDLVAPPPDGGEWTIVGSIYSPDDGAASATVWTSEDGRDWDTETVGAARAGRDVSIAAATRGDDGLVAVGRVGDGDRADAAVWAQHDGEWAASTPDAMAGDHEQWAFDVAAGAGGTVVAGGENVWGEVRPRLWFSADGESWTSVDGGAGGVFDSTGEETVRAVAAIGDGFVAVGSRTLDGEQDGLAWYSADGETWEAVDAPALAGGWRQDVLTVTAFDGGLVAGGMSDVDTNGQGDPVVWRSPDGRTWEPATGALPMTDSRSAARDLAVRSLSFGPTGGLIAAGGNDWRPRMWQSTDGGVSWAELPDPVHGDLFQDGVTLRAAASLNGVTLAIGGEPSVLMLASPRWQDVTSDAFPKGGTTPFATAVTGGDDLTLAAGGQFTAGAGETRESIVGQLWRRSGDGWEPLDSGNLAAGHVMDATPFAGGYVAVGVEDFGLAATRDLVADDLPDGLVWVSPNGTDWTRVGTQNARINEQALEFLENPTPEMAPVIAQLEMEAPPLSVPPAGGDGTRSLGAVDAFQDGYIAVGSSYDASEGEPIILVSPDGTTFLEEQPPHSGPGVQRYDDVCVGADDVAVVVGVSGGPGSYDVIAGARTAGGWVAGDGPGFGGGGDQQTYACAAGDDGFVIVGSDDRSGTRDARVWTSSDGVTWDEVTSGVLGGSGDQWASAVAAVPGGGWLVAGTDSARGDGDIALWRIDADGHVTRRDAGETALGGPGEQTVTNIAVDDDGAVTLAGNDYGRVGLWQSDTVDR